MSQYEQHPHGKLCCERHDNSSGLYIKLKYLIHFYYCLFLLLAYFYYYLFSINNCHSFDLAHLLQNYISHEVSKKKRFPGRAGTFLFLFLSLPDYTRAAGGLGGNYISVFQTVAASLGEFRNTPESKRKLSGQFVSVCGC